MFDSPQLVAQVLPEVKQHADTARFRSRTWLLLAIIGMLGFGWWWDRHTAPRVPPEYDVRVVIEAIELAESFKQHIWRVSDHLLTNTDVVEADLGDSLAAPAGSYVVSTGWGNIKLRRPEPQTFRQVEQLLESENSVVREDAVKLLALYGEAYYAAPLDEQQENDLDLLTSESLPRLLPLLRDERPRIRGVAALAVGQLAIRDEPRKQAMPALIAAFQHEKDLTVRLYLSWAIKRLLG